VKSPQGKPEASAPRRFPRYPIQLPVRYCVQGPTPPRVGVGWTHTLGEGGAGVELGEQLAPGTPLTVLLAKDQRPLELHAEVLWTGEPLEADGGILHGFAFTEADPKSRQALRDLLQALSVSTRAGLRLSIAIPASCQRKYPPSPPLQGRTGNLSREGLLLLLPEAVAQGTVLAVTLDSPRGPVNLEGVVAWVDAPPRGSSSADPVRHGVRLTSHNWATALALGLLISELV